MAPRHDSAGGPVSAAELMGMMADGRRRAADLIDPLGPEQLDAPSLCGVWTVKQVAAHLIAPFVARRRWFLPLILRSGFNLHRANRAGGADRPPPGR